MIGMFVLAGVFPQLETPGAKIEQYDAPDTDESKARNRLTWEEFKPCKSHVIRSSFIGAFIGMLPGLGSAIAAVFA